MIFTHDLLLNAYKFLMVKKQIHIINISPKLAMHLRQIKVYFCLNLLIFHAYTRSLISFEDNDMRFEQSVAIQSDFLLASQCVI